MSTFIVTTFESESGWGSKTEKHEFHDMEAAEKFRDHINSFNDFQDRSVPDYYMIAEEEIKIEKAV